MSWRWFLAAVCLALIGWAGARTYGLWRFRTNYYAAGQELAAGRYAAAHERLVPLAKQWPHAADVQLALGYSALHLGQIDEALAAWGRVPPGPKAGTAALERGRIAYAHGRFAIAEQSLLAALASSGPERSDARATLSRLWRYQGRYDDVRKVLEDAVEDSPEPAEVLRDLWLLDAETIPLGLVREALDAAEKEAPGDERVWLSRANLALRAGHPEEARPWVERILEKSPNDPAVWRVQLEYARATGDVAGAQQALGHLPADAIPSSTAHALRAWFAAERADTAAERAALEDLLRASPGDTHAIERLADLLAQAGEHAQVGALRKQKAELDEAWEKYRKMVAAGDLSRAGELAELAEKLGRDFEAKGWARLALRQDSGDTRARELAARVARRLAARETPSAARAKLAAASSSAKNLPRDSSPLRNAGAPAVAFVDDAASAGLRFQFENGRTILRQLPETMSGGVGLIDFDGDGWLDVYAIQGGPFPPEAKSSATANDARGDRLFHNRGDGTFEDVTERAGLAGYKGYGHGVAVGDYDNDGRPDLFVTRWRGYALYRNQGDGTFADVTAAAGLSGDRDWPTSAAWADLDGDGDLDLYVCHYVKWDAANPKPCHETKSQEYSYCHPRLLESQPDHLFRNDSGRFVDVTAEAGIVDRDGRGLGVLAADLDEDGRVDLFVANDTTANYFFHNRGGMKFEERALEAGLASNAAGGYLAGMGIACGDLDADGRLDLAVTNFYAESTTFYHNLGGGLFTDRTGAIGLAVPTRFVLGFGLAFLDVNNDGWLDILGANGNVNDFRPNFPYAMPAQLFLGGPSGKVSDVTARAGPPFAAERVGRGLAVGDLDNDGRLDALVVAQDVPLGFFHNQTPPGGHWLILRLEGKTSNRDAVGARVVVTAGGKRYVAARVGGGSYLSASDGRIHFGLGEAEAVDSFEVTWPSGRVEERGKLAVDAGYVIREGEAQAERLPAFGGKRVE